MKTTEKYFEKSFEEVSVPACDSVEMLTNTASDIASRCKDFIVPYEYMSVKIKNHRPALSFFDKKGFHEEFNFTPFSFQQFCNQIGVPSEYMMKCFNYEDSYASVLAESDLSFWLSARNRAAATGSSKLPMNALVRVCDDHIRGFLSERYTAYDNVTLAEMLESYLPDSDFRVAGSCISEEIFHARVINRKPLDIPGETSPVFWGFCIDNSDVGRSALTVRFVVWRQVCTNGLIVPCTSSFLVRSYHKGSNDSNEDMMLRAFDSAPNAVSKIEQFIKDNMMISISDKFSGDTPSEYFTDEIKARTGLPTKSVNEIINMVTNGFYPKTQWGLINAITDYAHKYSLDRRMDIEVAAGKMLLAA